MTLNKRSIIPCLLLGLTLSGTGALLSMVSATPSYGAYCESHFVPVHERLKPLADLLAKGEGNYNSVNRGRAGDTPQGIKGLTGKTFDQFTVQQVIEMQGSWLYAVGRYQFIPKTLRFAVRMSDVQLKDKFTAENQDKLMAALIMYKRPAIGAYLRGDHGYVGWALDELAKEWASVEYRNGRGYYDHIGGNRAHITRDQAWEVLQLIKRDWLKSKGRLA